MLPLTFLLASAFPVAGCVTPAYAQPDPELAISDPRDRWHIMTADPATTTSTCVGNPKTGLCAVETILACSFRHDDELCRIAMGGSERIGLFNHAKMPGDLVKYRVIVASWLEPEDLPPVDHDWTRLVGTQFAPWIWKVGDLSISIIMYYCEMDDPCPGKTDKYTPASFVLRKEADRWRVIDCEEPCY